MEMVNGYVFLDLTKSNVYSKALKVLGTDKPVVIKDGSGSPYFVDSLTLDGTNVVITKGGKTITIANDNTITNVGDIQNHLYTLTLHYSDTNFVVYTNDKGLFDLNDNYRIVNSDNEYVLSDELTNSLLSILDKIKVGDYHGINFVYVGDESTPFVNKSNDSGFNIEDDNGSTLIEVVFETKSVSSSNNEDWFITFKQLF